MYAYAAQPTTETESEMEKERGNTLPRYCLRKVVANVPRFSAAFLFGKFLQVDKQQTNPGITSSKSLQKLNTPK